MKNFIKPERLDVRVRSREDIAFKSGDLNERARSNY